MRLSLRKKTADSWMLEETRQYLTKKPDDFKRRQPKRNALPFPLCCKLNLCFYVNESCAILVYSVDFSIFFSRRSLYP